MAFRLETEVAGLSTQVGQEYATLADAAQSAFQRSDLSRSIAGAAPAFRAVGVETPITEEETAAWVAFSAQLGFATY